MDKQNALVVAPKATGSKQAIVDSIKFLLLEVNFAMYNISNFTDITSRENALKDLSKLQEELLEVFALIAVSQINK